MDAYTYSEQELIDRAEQLYIYALPLVVSEMVHRDYPNDRIVHDRVYPTRETAKFGKPNRDTLYSAGFVQLADTPYELTIPKVTDRYILFPFFSPYGDVVDSLGTSSGRYGKYLLIQAGQEIPEGYEAYEPIVFRESLIGFLMRIETKEQQDYSVVHQIQDQVILKPIYRDRLRPVADKPEKIDPVVYAKSLSDQDFYELYAALLRDNPPLDDETDSVFTLFGYDRESGTFIYDRLDDLRKRSLAQGRQQAENRLAENDLSNLQAVYDGTWLTITGNMGAYGENHVARARVMGSPGGWGANLPSECIYLDAETDSEHNRLETTKNYKIHFKADGLPHAGAFWSLAVYGSDTGDVTEAENGRYSLNSNDYNNHFLQANADGSLDIYVGPDAPDASYINNWIEAVYPNDDKLSFNIRVYIPDDFTQKGLWKGPEIIEV